MRALAGDYVRFRRDFDRERRGERRLTLQREWFRQLLGALGYAWSPANHPLDDGDEAPVLCAAGGRAGAPALLALGAYDAEAEGEDPLALRPHRLQFHGEAPPPEALLRERTFVTALIPPDLAIIHTNVATVFRELVSTVTNYTDRNKHMHADKKTGN